MTFEEFRANVIGWSKDRLIIPNSTPQAQTLKAVSEIGELCDAIAKGNDSEIVDAIGDICVCLVNIAELSGISFDLCLEAAWNEIRYRKGYMNENGVFIKDVPK